MVGLESVDAARLGVAVRRADVATTCALAEDELVQLAHRLPHGAREGSRVRELEQVQDGDVVTGHAVGAPLQHLLAHHVEVDAREDSRVRELEQVDDVVTGHAVGVPLQDLLAHLLGQDDDAGHLEGMGWNAVERSGNRLGAKEGVSRVCVGLDR